MTTARHPVFSASLRLCVRLTIGLLFVARVPAAQPAWWTDDANGTRIIDASASHATSENYAPANLGQLKNVAKKAKAHLDKNLPGQAGSTIDAMVAEFANVPADNYAPINLGQLKAVVKPFYDRLIAADYDTAANLQAHGFSGADVYPWNTITPDNYAPANIGQLKMAFSFNLSADPWNGGAPPPAKPWFTGDGFNITLGWAPTLGIASYTVERWENGAWHIVTIIPGSGSGSSFSPGVTDQSQSGGGSSNLAPGVIYLYRVTTTATNGHSSTSEVVGAVVNPDENDDDDDLTNGEEVDAGYYVHELAEDTVAEGTIRLGENPSGWVGPDPKLSDTDVDGYNDDVDGWANNPAIHPPRVPVAKYAVIRLDKLGFPEDRNPVQINDFGQIVGAIVDGAPVLHDVVFWDPEDMQSINVKSTDANTTFTSGFSYGSARILNNSGTISGTLATTFVDSETTYSAAIWTKEGEGAIQICSNYQSPYISGEDDQSYRTWGQSINDSGTIVGTETGAGRGSNDPGFIKWEGGGIKWTSPNSPVPIGDHITWDTSGLVSGGEYFDPLTLSQSGSVIVGKVLHYPTSYTEGQFGIYDGTLHVLGEFDQAIGIADPESIVQIPVVLGSHTSELGEKRRPYLWVKQGSGWNGFDLVVEKTDIASGPSDFMWPAGASAKFEVLTTKSGMYINGKPTWPLEESTTWHWDEADASAINKDGVVVGMAANLHPDVGESGSKPVELIKCDLAVDANRDGVIKTPGNYYSTNPDLIGKPQDITSKERPFRFWCNDDHDISDTDESGEGLTGAADSADNEIKSDRDLEDFARLHLYIGGLQEVIANGTIQVGLEWRNTSGGSPSIKVYRAAEPDGGTQYLRNDNGSGGLGNEYAAILQTGAPFKTALGTIDSTGGFKFPLDFWQSTGSGITAFDADHPSRYIIFEGVTEGKGQLVMTFWKGTTKIGEGGGAWLDIKQIKKMYQRWDSATGHPWAADQFEAPSNEPKDDVIVFVHGWRMSPDGAGNFAETMFKRLWNRGFKGGFVAYHWDTYWYDAWQWLPQNDAIGAALAHYNDSEYIAWQAAAALKSHVDSLPFKNKNIIAHSMGNIVVSEALRLGMSIKNYAMLNAAVPASCFDEDETRIKQAPKAGPVGITLWNVETPDGETDSVARSVAYRGTHKNIGGTLINFYLETDNATSVGWEVNNRIAKPEPLLPGDQLHTYEFDPDEDAGHHLYKRNANNNNVQYYFDSSRKYEGMSEACQSWGKVVGAWGNTQGAIDDKVNMGDPALNGAPRGFDTEHSAEFNRRIQQLTPFYNKLLDKLEVTRSHP